MAEKIRSWREAKKIESAETTREDKSINLFREFLI
jgi:hypothetical protein